MIETASTSRTVAVTGATGLIGRNLCNHFALKGWQVHALVRNTGVFPFADRGIKVFKCDLPGVLDPTSISGVDALIHCAYMTRFTKLNEAKKVNEQGTEMLYEASKEAGVKKFVFVSSMAARENAQSYYGQSKYRIESILDLSKDIVIRPGLVLSRDSGLFARIVNQVERLPVIPAFGGGQQKMNTIHIEDLCNVFEWAVEHVSGGIITAAESESITMKEMFKAVLQQQDRSKPIVHVPGVPFVFLLKFLELFNLKLPVSSENLQGLLNREDIEFTPDEKLRQSGVFIRSARESICDLL
jgi:nucleoside-diphosphate-sugar epimerase